MPWYQVLEVKIISNQKNVKKRIYLQLKLWQIEMKNKLK